MTHFEHTFPTRNGSAKELFIQQDNFHTGNGLYLRLTGREPLRSLNAWLTEENARALYSALHTRYGVPADEPFQPASGTVVKLLPGHSADFSDATKVRVTSGPDSDGDYWVRAVDGHDLGDSDYVHGSYLAPLDPEPAAIEVGKEYKLLPDSRSEVSGCTRFPAGVTRVKVYTEKDGDGDHYVMALDGVDSGTYRYVAERFLAPLDPPAWAPGDEAIVTRDKPLTADLFAGDRVRVAAIRPADSSAGRVFEVTFLSGRGGAPTYKSTWNVWESDLRRP